MPGHCGLFSGSLPKPKSADLKSPWYSHRTSYSAVGWGKGPCAGLHGDACSQRAQSSGHLCNEDGCQPRSRACEPAARNLCLNDETSQDWDWLLDTTKPYQGTWDAGDHHSSGDELLQSQMRGFMLRRNHEIHRLSFHASWHPIAPKTRSSKKGGEEAEKISNAQATAITASCVTYFYWKAACAPTLQRGQESPRSPCQSDHLTLVTGLSPTYLEAKGKLYVLKLPSLLVWLLSSYFVCFLLSIFTFYAGLLSKSALSHS